MRSDLPGLVVVALAALACEVAPREDSLVPAPSGVEPARGYSVRAATVLIHGQRFLARTSQPAGGGPPVVDTHCRAWLGGTELEAVTWLDERTLRATVPTGLAPGPHDLEVENAYAQRGSLPAAYAVEPGTPPALASDLRLATHLASEGQQVQVDLVVTNSGEADALAVTPTLAATPAGLLDLGPLGTQVQDVPGGGSRTFSWILTARAAGEISLVADGTGRDPVTGAPLALPAAGAGPLRVVALGILAAAASVSAPQATVGQTVALTVDLLNSGARAVNGVTTTAELGGAGSLLLLSAPGPVDLGPGQARQVIYLFTAGVPGPVTIGVATSGTEDTTGRPLAAAPAAAGVEVQTPPALTTSLVVAPPRVSAGQRVTLTATVANGGDAAAAGVVPTIASAPPAVALVAPPEARTVPGHGSASFDLVLSTGAPATGSVSVDAAGTDANAGAPVAAARATSQELTIEAPAALIATVAAAPSRVDVGQQFTLTLGLRNSGTATAAVSAVALNPAAAAICGGQDPATPGSIGGGLTQSFTWRCVAAAAGILALSATTTWLDANVGTSQTLTPSVPAAVTVQAPAQLSATIAASPGTVSIGQTLTVTLRAINNGAAGAIGVAPSTPSVVPAAGASCGAVSPAGPQAIAGGASLDFSWTCTASAAGSVAFDATVSGTDSNSGGALSAAPGAPASLTVQVPAALSATVAASRAAANTGQAFTLTLSLANAGGAAAAVSAVALNAAAAAICGGQSPSAPRTIPGSQALAFSWTCASSSAGSLSLNATVTWSDANLGTIQPPLTPAAAAAVTVQAPAALTAAYAPAPPASVNTGQVFTVTVRVTNTGEASALAVTPSAIAGCATPAGAAVTPAAPVSFTYTGCSAGTPGSFPVNASASGTDANSGGALTTNALTRSVTVQAPAALTATYLPAPPASRNTGQAFTVTVQVTNTGGASALGVTPTAIAGCTTPGAAPVTPATPVSFAYTGCSSSTPGPFPVNASVSGTDANSGAAVASNALAGTVVVQAPAALTAAYAPAPPASVNAGQVFTVTVRATNAGGATATSARPAAVPGCTRPAAATVTPAAPVDFTYTGCSSASLGSFSVSTLVRGTDANSGAAVTSNSLAGAVTVQAPAALTAAYSPAPPISVSTGQVFTVTVRVTNTGGANASTVRPTAIAGCTAPGAATVTPASPVAFIYTGCSAGTPGTFPVSASASGTDANSGAALTSNALSGAVVVQAAAALAAAYAPAPPASVDTGQVFAVTVRATNTGGANALAVTPTAIAGCTTPAAATVTAAAPVSFTYADCSASAPGSFPADASLSGIDANSGAPVISNALSGAVTVQVPAALSASLVIAPDPVPAGAGFTVTMLVSNGGGATAIGVHPVPDPLAESGTGTATCSGSPLAAQDIAGGGSQDFVWSCTNTTASPPATIQYGGSASGIDANTGLAVTSPPASSNGVTLEASPTPGSARSPVAGATEVIRVASDPFGDGTPFAYVRGYLGGAWVGPSRDGKRFLRFDAKAAAPVEDDDPPIAVEAPDLFAGPPGEGAPTPAIATWACGTGPCPWLQARLGSAGSEAATLLAATPGWLYLAFANRVTGLQLYRTRVAPARISDFRGRNGCAAGTPGCEGLGGNGFGDPSRPTRVLDAAVVTAGKAGSLWLTVGDGTLPVMVYRVPD